MGGTGSVRGFVEDGILPADDEDWPAHSPSPSNPALLDSDKTSLGGNFFVLSRSELRFPLGRELEGGIFLDMGELLEEPSAYDPEGMAAGTGIGLRFQTPIGPFVIDLGMRLLDGRRRQAFLVSESFRIHFAIGYY